MITKFDRAALRMLSTEIDAALAELAAKHGISLHIANGTYFDDTMTFKLKGAVLDTDGVAADPTRIALEKYYPQYVDKAVSLGRKLRGTVVGYNSRAKKYPFLVKTPKGTYKVAEYDLK